MKSKIQPRTMPPLLPRKARMRTTVTIDDALFAKALGLAPPGIEKSELLRECLQAFIRQQAAKRLAALGGQVPEIELAPRQRQAPAP